VKWLVLLILWDLQNLVARFRPPISVDPWLSPSDDYTVIVPLYGDPRYFENRSYLEPLKGNVLLAVHAGDKGMDRFAVELETDGWRVHRARCHSRPIGVPEIVYSALKSGLVGTTYVVRLDGDSHAQDDIGCAIAAIARADADVCSVKVRVSEPRRAVEQLQAVEYDMSMLSRHFRPWLTSGACMVAKADVLRLVLAYHSRWFPGEDMETGRIAKHFGFRVLHCDWSVYTKAPSTWRGWFRQRRSWWSGNFRHAIQNFDVNVRYSAWMVYYAGLVWGMLTGKLLAFVHEYEYIPLLVCAYTVVTVVANWQVRNRWMLAFPYYALFQVVVMPPVGAYFYVRLCLQRGRVGRYRIGARRRPVTEERLAGMAALARRDYATASGLLRSADAPESAVATALLRLESLCGLEPVDAQPVSPAPASLTTS
jgi:cellulose synthase/poly-beta-1,6-N-acetylglucosamine synthase-like glycosyltransferase